jgi:hypothetical protein
MRADTAATVNEVHTSYGGARKYAVPKDRLQFDVSVYGRICLEYGKHA